jgi:hypothetical protein
LAHEVPSFDEIGLAVQGFERHPELWARTLSEISESHDMLFAAGRVHDLGDAVQHMGLSQ